MTFVLIGLIFGLLLAVSLGPIFIALTQTSIEKGIKPGLSVGLGVWISDIIFIYVFYNFIKSIKNTVESEFFIFWMAISGAIVLAAFGIGLLFKKPELNYKKIQFSMKNYLGFWLKGFLINTVNPFTFVFWMGVISTYIIGRDINGTQSLILLSTIFIVIILSDIGKVYLAHFLKNWLTPKHINWVADISGVILIGFGCFLAYSVI